MVLKLLTVLYQVGLSYSAINTARSALSVVIRTKGGKTVGSDPIVVRLLKGIYELRTPLPRYSATWDVSTLLSHFKQLDNIGLSLKDWSLKLCALLLLVYAQRVQTIHLIESDCVHIFTRMDVGLTC